MPEISESRYLVTCGWDDVPHLTDQAKRELLASTPPHLREARSQGIPSLGSGAIYPVPVSEITVDPFAIPAFWPRAYGLDVGWRMTAAVWLARDPMDGRLYAYAEYARGEAVPGIHGMAIKSRGEWIRGAVDPASRGRSQTDGKRLWAQYRTQGLRLAPAENAVESGLREVWERLETGRLKLFRTMQKTLAEYRIYRRDELGRVVKQNDHLMDALRYAVMSFDKIARVQPVAKEFRAPKGAADSRAGY